MKQDGQFILFNREEFKQWLDKNDVKREITHIQQHHTANPSYKDCIDGNEIELMKNMQQYHIKSKGMRDIAQHISTFKNGLICIGRNFEWDSGGMLGKLNIGSICIENIGNFNVDIMTDEQKKSILFVTALLCMKFGLKINTNTIRYHSWYKNTSCPSKGFFGGDTKQDAERYFYPLVQQEINKILNIPVGKSVLKMGSKGQEVKELQENLIILGYDLKTDGIYGNITATIVGQLQERYGLKPIDGIVGKDTYALINRLIEERKRELEKVVSTLGYQKIRRFDSDVHIYTTNKDEFVDIELGKTGKLETVKEIINAKKSEGKNIVAGINCGFFNFSAKPEHLGLLIDEGKYYYPPSGTFVDFMYFKDGKTEIVNLKGYDKAYLSKLQAETYWAIGTSWSLVQKGVINLENANKFSHSKQKHPRTLFGQRKDGNFVLVVVDGRSFKSKGVTAEQSAKIMFELGCYNAANCDGGGSSYMIVNDKLVSVPSDGAMRKIGSAMLVYSNKSIQKPTVDYTKFPIVKLGSKNEYVGIVQKELLKLGYDLGKYGADNSFGALTDKAIRDFQKSKGLKVDGIVGQNSYKKLFG